MTGMAQRDIIQRVIAIKRLLSCMQRLMLT